jgi:hypothetical protein
MAIHFPIVYQPSCSDQIKEKISYSQRRVWQERLKSKRVREQPFLLWEQNIANAAKKGGIGEEELDWDSYDKIKEQLVFNQILQAEEKEKETLMAIAGAKKFIQSWRENIAKAAKIGGSGEQELDWDSYEKIKEEMIILDELQRTTRMVKAKEMAIIKGEKEALIKAIKKIMLRQKREYLRERKKARENIKRLRYKNPEEDRRAVEVTQEFKLVSKLTKVGFQCLLIYWLFIYKCNTIHVYLISKCNIIYVFFISKCNMMSQLRMILVHLLICGMN